MDTVTRLVGEGFQKPNADKELPIDIVYNKLSEWLVDRKQVPADWVRKLQAVQATAAQDAKEVPAGLLPQQPDGEGDGPAVDYFAAKHILAQLAGTAEKGLLGGYKGEAGKWDKIVRAYEANLLWVAEAAQAMARRVDYDAPSCRQQAQRAQQQLADLEKRRADSLKSASAAAADYKQACADLGIAGVDLRGELLGLTASLPDLMDTGVGALSDPRIGEAIAYYRAMTETVCGVQPEVLAREGLLPVLAEVREGRTAPMDPTLRPAAQPSAAEPPPVAAPAGISWGDDDEPPATDDVAGGGISWDVQIEAGDEPQAAPDAEPAGSGAAGINWDIDVSSSGQGASVVAATAGGGSEAEAPAAAQHATSLATGDLPVTIERLIDDAEYRIRLLDDLLELRAFLSQRTVELAGGSTSEVTLHSGSELVQHTTLEAAIDMRAAVDEVLALLSDETLKQLLMIRTRPRFLDAMVQGLEKRSKQEGKFVRAAEHAELRRGEVQRSLVASSARLAALARATREAKEAVQAALGVKLARRVNIMGEINNLIS